MSLLATYQDRHDSRHEGQTGTAGSGFAGVGQ